MNKRVIHPPLADHGKLRQGLTTGEQKVLELFNQHLPVSWEIYVQPHLNGLRPDFVLLNPQGGIAVFEVKDWNLNAMRYFTRKDRVGAYRALGREGWQGILHSGFQPCHQGKPV